MSRNPKRGIPSLAKLRECGFAKVITSKNSAPEWQQVRPGLQRKVYARPAQKLRLLYAPAMIQGERLRSISEIHALIDKRTLEELQTKGEDALAQLLRRACCGDERAILLYVSIVRRAVRDLELLAVNQPDKVRAEAETMPRWPVLLSLNPQDITWAKEQISRLHVGNEADTPTRPGQRLDPHNFWTSLASRALTVCRINREVALALKKHAAGAIRKRQTQKCWGTALKATFYTLQDGEGIMIEDWQHQCVKLSESITTDNFNDWWKVIKACVLHFWHFSKEDYVAALKQVYQPSEKEWRRRNMALDRVRQALESLIDLQ